MLYPLFFIVLLVFIVGGFAITHRVNSVRSGKVSIKYYQLMSGETAPDNVVKSTRCFNNLFEIPVLFYTVSCLYISLNIDSPISLVFAWLFVILRYAQAWIHLSYNNVLHRMSAFWGATLSVLALWIILFIHIL